MTIVLKSCKAFQSSKQWRELEFTEVEMCRPRDNVLTLDMGESKSRSLNKDRKQNYNRGRF
jgi:hypothetical protein